MPRLPSLPPGGPGRDEALESYLERCAELHRTSPDALARRVGIEAVGGTNLTIALLLPTHRSLAAMSEALNLSLQEASHMTLRRFALQLGLPPASDARDLSRLAARHWFFISWSRFCPECLAETGQWQIGWRLPLSTRCNQHGIRLHDKCPDCGGWPRSAGSYTASARSFLGERRRPSTCYLPKPLPNRSTGRGAKPCGADLTNTTTIPETITVADQLLNAATDGRPTQLLGRPTPPNEALALWREAVILSAWLTEHRTNLRPRPLRSPIRSPLTTRRLVNMASGVLATASPAEGAENFLRDIREAGIEPDSHWFRDRLPNQPTSAMSELVQATLAHTGRFTTRVTRTLRPDPLWGYTADQLPQRFWPCTIPTALQHAAHLSSPAKEAFVSLCLARFLSGSWTEGARLLGWRAATGPNRARNVIGKTPATHRDLLISELSAIAHSMDRCPPSITFASRRLGPEAQLASMYAPACGREWCPCQVACGPSIPQAAAAPGSLV